jgi:hypothetical protein
MRATQIVRRLFAWTAGAGDCVRVSRTHVQPKEIAISLAANLTRDIYLSLTPKETRAFLPSLCTFRHSFLFFIFTFCCFVEFSSERHEGEHGNISVAVNVWGRLCCLYICPSSISASIRSDRVRHHRTTWPIVIYEMSEGAVASGRRTMYVYNWFGCAFPGPPLSPFFSPFILSLLFPKWIGPLTAKQRDKLLIN